jgi:hypothetical protein
MSYFETLKDKVLKMYEKEKNKNAREYYAKEIYKKALDEHGYKSLEPKIFKELEQLPRIFLSKDSFFYQAKNCNFNDSKIVSSLFSPYLASEEHIHAISNGGEDVIGNKIVAHRNCNSNRANKPYTEILNFHPDLLQNIQKQIDFISKNLINDNLPERLRTYPIYIADTFNKTSNGIINVDINDYCHKMLEKTEQKISNNEKNIQNLRDQKNQIDLQLNELKKENTFDLLANKKLKAYLETQDELHRH